MNSLAVNSSMPKQLEIGTRYRRSAWGTVWTIGGYVYYEDELWYVCVSEGGVQEDDHWKDVKDYLKKYGAA